VPFVSQGVATTDTVGHTDKKRSLTTLTGPVEDAKFTPVIDRRYTFEQIPDAVGYQEHGHAAGKVVVSV